LLLRPYPFQTVFWHTTCIPDRTVLSSTHTEISYIEPKCSDTFVFTSRKFGLKKFLQQTYDTENRQTERSQCLSTVVLNANQPNTRQVTFVDATDCCGVRFSFAYSASFCRIRNQPLQDV